jgi:hypothetical protein
MSRTYIDIVFEGEKFSPTKLKDQTGLDLLILAESGTVSYRGRYKGHPSPYGLAVFKVESTLSEDLNIVLETIINSLLEKKEILRTCAVDEITLDLENFSQSEIDLNIDKKIIRMLSELNASLEISSLVNDRIFTSTQGSFKLDTVTKKSNLLNDFFYTIEFENSISKLLSKQEFDSLFILFHQKFETAKISKLKFSEKRLMPAIILYLLKYVKEPDLSKVPSFEEVFNKNEIE